MGLRPLVRSHSCARHRRACSAGSTASARIAPRSSGRPSAGCRCAPTPAGRTAGSIREPRPGARASLPRGVRLHLRPVCDTINYLLTSLVRLCPDTPFVLDHLGKPPVASGDTSPGGEICEACRLPNVSCKLSGLTTEARPRLDTRACFTLPRVSARQLRTSSMHVRQRLARGPLSTTYEHWLAPYRGDGELPPKKRYAAVTAAKNYGLEDLSPATEAREDEMQRCTSVTNVPSRGTTAARARPRRSGSRLPTSGSAAPTFTSSTARWTPCHPASGDRARDVRNRDRDGP